MNEAKEFFHYPTLSHLHKCKNKQTNKRKQGFGTGHVQLFVLRLPFCTHQAKTHHIYLWCMPCHTEVAP